MKKVYRKLTKDQRERGIVFSSQLVVDYKQPSELDGSIHELTTFTEEADNLKKDSFFKGSNWNYNIIRQ